MRGKTINIYIPDGDPKGIKICSIDTSIVKAIYVPRNRLELAALRKEIKEPGIYFLFGMEEERSKPIVYIGEAENLLNRLRQHNANKDFWNLAVCFVSEKNNINKAHIKYLENYSCSEAKRIDKCRLENVVTPTQSTLTEQDTDFVLSFFDDLKILLTSLGFPIFEESNKEESNIFICKGKNASAEGVYEEGGMLVFKGARCNIEETPSFGNYAKRMRRLLLEQGILKEDNGLYILTEDYLFSSPSTASDIVLGRSSNGWTIWKSKDAGETLDKRYRR